MAYSEVIKYLNSFVSYERESEYSYKQSFKLERFKEFLKSINNPQKDLKVIHVAGSKGKGSVCAFIAYILREAGFRVGLYTSPHLVDFRERIRILNSKFQTPNPKQIPNSKSQVPKLNDFEGMISKSEICDLVFRLKSSIDKFNNSSECDGLTFFEAYTALAFQYFKEKNVDFVVLETGLGGRLDATNVCSSLISVITPISYEHTKLLGKTLDKIAFEKASIIKKENKIALNGKIIALTAKQHKEAMQVIKMVAKSNNAILLKEGKNFKLKKLRINLLGTHQIANANLAAATVRALKFHNINVSENAIKRGLSNCRWPARFEIISKNPTIIIDGAHNSVSMRVLRNTLKQFFPHKKIWLIFGIAKDKELKDTCKELSKISNNIILTKSNNPRASEPKDLLKYFNPSAHLRGGTGLFLADSTKEALNLAKEKADKNDIIVITGSLYICGEIREIINSCKF